MHFLQSELGDVVYVELPEIGKEVKAGATFGVVESVKVRHPFRISGSATVHVSVVRLAYQYGIHHGCFFLTKTSRSYNPAL